MNPNEGYWLDRRLLEGQKKKDQERLNSPIVHSICIPLQGPSSGLSTSLGTLFLGPKQPPGAIATSLHLPRRGHSAGHLCGDGLRGRRSVWNRPNHRSGWSLRGSPRAVALLLFGFCSLFGRGGQLVGGWKQGSSNRFVRRDFADEALHDLII